jgi:putative transposase
MCGPSWTLLDMDTARLLLNQTLQAYETRAPKAMAVLEAGFDDATAVLVLPERYRKRLRTTMGSSGSTRRFAAGNG